MHHSNNVPALLALLCLLGCDGAPGPIAEATAAVDPAPEVGEASGSVRLPPESARFVTVESIPAPERHGVVRAPGRVAFRDGATASIGAPIEGRVIDVHVRVGDAVSAGNPMVTLRSPVAAAARAELKGLIVARDGARKAVERQIRMMESGVGVPAESLAAETQLAEAEAELARAQRAVAFLGEETGETVVVRAPIDGTVVERATAVGASVTPGNGALIELGDPSALWVVADVFERDLPLIAEGAPASVEIASAGGRLEGRVVAIGAVLSSALRAAPVYVAIEADGVRLRPGMYARTTIESDSPRGVLLPTTAVLIKDGRRTVVYVETGKHTFQAREVTVGHAIDGRVQILEGLDPGERVVVRGALLLDGAADQLI